MRRACKALISLDFLTLRKDNPTLAWVGLANRIAYIVMRNLLVPVFIPSCLSSCATDRVCLFCRARSHVAFLGSVFGLPVYTSFHLSLTVRVRIWLGMASFIMNAAN